MSRTPLNIAAEALNRGSLDAHAGPAIVGRPIPAAAQLGMLLLSEDVQWQRSISLPFSVPPSVSTG
jgi:hypothetical protein